MADVVIKAKDQLRAVFVCDSGIARELWEEFAFFVPGYKFMPAFKRGWDGKARMFDMRSRSMFRGLVPKAIAWLMEAGYTVEFENKEDFRPQLKYDSAWLDGWNRYAEYEPFDHQAAGINGSLKQNHAIVLSPTGSGKSYMIYMMCRWILEQTENKILITVPSTNLVDQLFKDFEEYSNGRWNVESNVHKIYSGKEKVTDKRIIVSTWQSARMLSKEWFQQFDAYICDEAHQADSKCISAIIDNIAHTAIRVGLTGTLDGTVMHLLEMLGRFGPVVKTASSKELQDKGLLAKINIDACVLEYSPEECKLVKGAEYQQEIDFIINHHLRNNFLINSALKSDGNCLMLFNYIEKHGKILFDKLNEKALKLGRKVYYIDGATDVDSREAIRTILEKEKNAILLASFGTMSVGVNIKRIDTIVFCHPFKSKIRVLQAIGRGLRTYDGNNGLKLIDVLDNLTVKSKSGKETMNMVMRHGIERLKIYEEQGFPYRIIKIKMY